MKIIARTDFAPWIKLLLYLGCAGFAILAVWVAMDAVRTRNYADLYFPAIPLFLGCIAGLVYNFRHRLVLSETHLWQYGFSTKCIALDAIGSITNNAGADVISSGNTTIRLTTDLHHKNAFKAQLLARVQAIDHAENALPGRQLETAHFNKLLEQAHYLVHSGAEDGSLFEADASIFEELNESAYYVVYEHPVHQFLHRAFLAEAAHLQTFITERILPVSTPGYTLWLLPLSLEWVIGCTEDGDILFKSSHS